MQIHQMYGNSEIINWTNQKSGKSIFIILFNFVYVFDNPVHVQMQLN